MTVATPVLPNYTTDTGAEYPLNIDAALAVSAEVAHQFAPHPTEPPSMQIRVAPGRKQLPDGTLIEKPAQTSGVIAAPAANPRHDLVVIDNATANLEIIEGAEAADPADPAIPATKTPCARLRLTVGMTEIAWSAIDDLRPSSPPPADTSQLEADVAALDGRVTAAEGDIAALQAQVERVPANVVSDAVFPMADSGLGFVVIANESYTWEWSLSFRNVDDGLDSSGLNLLISIPSGEVLPEVTYWYVLVVDDTGTVLMQEYSTDASINLPAASFGAGAKRAFVKITGIMKAAGGNGGVGLAFSRNAGSGNDLILERGSTQVRYRGT